MMITVCTNSVVWNMKKKKLIDLLAYPEQTSLGTPSPKYHVVPGVPLLLEKGKEELTVIHECKTGYEAFALTIWLCAKISRIDSRFYLRRSVETNEYIIHTSHGDTIAVSYEDAEVYTDFHVNSRMESFKVLMFLYREVRKIWLLSVCLLENMTNRYFSLEIDEGLCAIVHYDPKAERFGTPQNLKREMELILSGRPPISEDEQSAMTMGLKLFEAFSNLVIPEEFAFLTDIDTSAIRLREQVLVSRHFSYPRAQPNPSNPVSKIEKKTMKQKFKQISKQKAIEKKSYISFWDRVEMRGDHDD